MTKSLVLIIAVINSSFILYSQMVYDTNDMGPLYFESPEKAIPEISKLLVDADWKTLSRYYELKDTDIGLEYLLSGDFFIRNKKPVAAHPAGFWKYKHPFAPGFRFRQAIGLEEPGVFEITVYMEIDQGDGMIQEGYRTFLMVKSEKGFQLLPGKSPHREKIPEKGDR